MNTVLSSFNLAGRLALVTGSSGGIGFALARGLAGAGAHIVLNARNEARLDAAAARLRNEGASVALGRLRRDRRSRSDERVARIEAEIGAIDILVNNAGMQRRAPLEDFPEEHWHELMRTNVDSVFLVGQAVARA